MSASNAKDIRKQVRNVMQETAKDLITQELGVEVERRLNEKLNARLDAIEEYVKAQLTKMDNRAKAVEGYLLGIVKRDIQSDVYNANLTIDAVVGVLAASGLAIEDFNNKVDAKKLELDAARKQAAGEKMRAEIEARAAEAKAAEQAQPEQEATPASE